MIYHKDLSGSKIDASSQLRVAPPWLNDLQDASLPLSDKIQNYYGHQPLKSSRVKPLLNG